MRARQGQLILMAMMVAALVSASCSTTAAPPTVRESGAETKPYGSLTVAGQFGTGHIDPQIASGATFSGLGNNIMDTLVYYDAKDVLTPGIAERWDISPDGKTHTFYIRKGVKFHDGSDLTGADVKFSIERMLKPESVTQSSEWKAVVEAVEQKDDYTVLLRLKQPRFELVNGVAGGMGAVMPKKYIEEKGEEYFRKNPIGSGPWRFVRFEPGLRLELEAVESHWRAVPKFERLTLLSVLEQASRNAMLKTGELDMSPVGTDAVANLEAAGVRIIGAPEGGGTRYFQWMWYDLERPDASPYGDLRVRRALQLSMNAKEMADKLFRGYGGAYALFPVRPTEPYFDPNRVKTDPFDPEGAKKLLAEAGYSGGFRTKLWDVGGGSELSLVNQAVTGYWDKIGVKAEIAPIEYNAFRAKYRPKVVPELWNTIWTYRTAASRGFGLTVFFHSKESTAQNIRDPKIDQLIDAALAAKDPQERIRLQREAAVLSKEAYTTLSVVEVKGLLGVSAKIGQVGYVEISTESTTALVYETIAHAK